MKYNKPQIIVTHFSFDDICTGSSQLIKGDDTIKYPWSTLGTFKED